MSLRSTETQSDTNPEITIDHPIRILVVDDEEPMLRALMRLLGNHGYECSGASSVAEARKLLEEASFSLVLSDVNMPGGSGIGLLENVSSDFPMTATVMVTGMDDRRLAEKALEMGAYGYVIKPYQDNELLIGVSNALRRRTLEIENARHRQRLEQMVDDRTVHLWNAIQELERSQRDLRLSREETIRRLAVAAEFRDDDTGRHIERMSKYCELLARRLGSDYEHRELTRVACVMHDVGKIGISDNILLKAGPLTEEEFAVMKTHPQIGRRILEGSDAEVLQLAATVAYTHHEWWDGNGYPDGLSGEDIPLEGRIAAIGDVFDALTTNRVYRKAFTMSEAIGIMRSESGSHFEPGLLDLFLDSIDELEAIRENA